MPILHNYTLTQADGTATSVVRPSDWNSQHEMGFQLAGNTSGTSFVTGKDIVLAGGNNVTLQGSTDAASGTVIFNADNNAIADGNGKTINNGTMVFSNANGVSFGISTSANGVNTMTASAAGGGAAYSGMWYTPEIFGSATYTSHANNTLYVRPFELNGYQDADRLMYLGSFVSTNSTTQSFSASVSQTGSYTAAGSWGLTGSLYLMTRVQTNETAASYNSIATFASASHSISAGYTASVTWSTNASSVTASVFTTAQIGAIKNIGPDGNFTTTNFASNGSTSFSFTSTGLGSSSSSFGLSNVNNALSGVRPYHVPLAGTNMDPDEYWAGIRFSSASGSTNLSLQRPITPGSWGPVGYYTNASYLELGNSANVANAMNYRPGFGSINGTVVTGNFALSNISTVANNISHYFAIMGITL